MWKLFQSRSALYRCRRPHGSRASIPSVSPSLHVFICLVLGNDRTCRFQSNAVARIEWLEDIVRKCLPGIDLNEGPQLFPNDRNTSTDPTMPSLSATGPSGQNAANPETQTPNNASSVLRNQGVKRSYVAANEEQSKDASVEQNARSMALHLGMLSLDVNSSQLHYLGSSSGSLFASIVQANRTNPSSTRDQTDPGEPAVIDGTEVSDASNERWESYDDRSSDDEYSVQVYKLLKILRNVSIFINV